jgi:hypothetical protein
MRLAPEDSLPSARSRWPAAFGRTGSALLLMLVSGIVGCATMDSKPPPPPEKKEPYLLLRLGERRLYVKDADASKVPPEGVLVAIGRPKYPTPTGRFEVNEMVVNPDFLAFDFENPARRDRGRVAPGPNNPLGLRWIGFAYDHGWAIGFHGTAKTDVLGQAVSHGCVRLSNDDVVKVYDSIKLGTPVVVEP